MAVLTIRNIEEAVKTKLRVRAAMHGRSMEEEARDILGMALCAEAAAPRDLGGAIHFRFAQIGGLDLPEIEREAIRTPVLDAD
ncbi:MAG: plasmid stabilization protein [Hyphomonadaceae bacterium]|nr:plasmid stabilization protein [Hyphomonadaceae bacterium]